MENKVEKFTTRQCELLLEAANTVNLDVKSRGVTVSGGFVPASEIAAVLKSVSDIRITTRQGTAYSYYQGSTKMEIEFEYCRLLVLLGFKPIAPIGDLG